jgi:hypothetical protein
MPDQALQQYAQMHKNDPYIMALAMSESNRRKTIRTGAQMNAPEEPKVVDQAIQSMAAPMPEDVGIGQLPTGEMNYAEGGIVAFSDGGDVPRFQDRGLVQGSADRANAFKYGAMRELSRISPGLAALFGGVSSAATGLSQAVLDGQATSTSKPSEAGAQVPPALRAQYLREVEEMGFGKRMQFSPEIAQVLAASTAADQKANLQREQDMAKQRTAALGLTSASPATAQKSVDATSVVNGPSAVEVTGTPPPNPAPNPARDRAVAAAAAAARASAAAAAAAAKPPVAPVAPAAPAAAAPPQGGLPDLQKQYEEILAKQKYEDPAKTNLTALTTKETAAAQDEKAALERDQARFANVFKGREERLGKREADINTQKNTNTSLALLNAGLAVMSTPGGLATALGTGAQVGTRQFAAGLDKIRSAQEKIDDARDRIEELRLNRDEMSAKEIRAAENKIRNVGIDAEKRVIDGVRQAGQINRDAAKAVFTSTAQQGIAQLEIAGREKVANIGLEGQRLSAAASSANAAATRALADSARMSALAENVRKNIADEAVKRFPYSTTDQATYQQQAMQAALRSNPGLSQYLGVPGGGGAPAAETATHRLNPATGKIEPVR